MAIEVRDLNAGKLFKIAKLNLTGKAKVQEIEFDSN
jgi:hypothetical protein